MSAWHIGKRERTAILWGTILCIILIMILFGYMAYSSPNYIIALIILGFAEAALFFSASNFGPWVGLFIGGFGSAIGSVAGGVLATLINGSINISDIIGFLWLFYPVVALLGFLTGLAILKTEKRYERMSNIALAMFFNILGIMVASILLFFLTHIGLIMFCTVMIPGFILHPIALFIYGRSTHRKKLIQVSQPHS